MIETTINLVQYDGNDSTTVFPFSFRVDDVDHLVAVVADAEDVQTPLTVDVDFTVSGIGDEAGGSVTYPIAGDPLPTGSTITIYRFVPLKQLTDFHNQGGFFPQTHEDLFDYLMMAIQQLQEQLDRCAKYTVTSQGDGDDLYDAILAALAAVAALADTYVDVAGDTMSGDLTLPNAILATGGKIAFNAGKTTYLKCDLVTGKLEYYVDSVKRWSVP